MRKEPTALPAKVLSSILMPQVIPKQYSARHASVILPLKWAFAECSVFRRFGTANDWTSTQFFSTTLPKFLQSGKPPLD
jgi:hypothetical protein